MSIKTAHKRTADSCITATVWESAPSCSSFPYSVTCDLHKLTIETTSAILRWKTFHKKGNPQVVCQHYPLLSRLLCVIKSSNGKRLIYEAYLCKVSFVEICFSNKLKFSRQYTKKWYLRQNTNTLLHCASSNISWFIQEILKISKFYSEWFFLPWNKTACWWKASQIFAQFRQTVSFEQVLNLKENNGICYFCSNLSITWDTKNRSIRIFQRRQ